MKWFITTYPSGNTWFLPWAYQSRIVKWRVSFKGGGLDPLFYILAVNLIHLAMRQLGVGVPVCVPPSVEMIASLGYVDDTVGFSSIDDRQRVADHLHVIIDCVGQRNNSSKMNVQVLQVKQGSVCSVSKSVVWDDKPVWSTSRHQHIKFLGGNANILGGFPTIKTVITRWSRTVISRLRGWPVSVGVAHSGIEGLVVNRLVFRCCVNVPTDVQISSVTGSICRVCRLVFGLAPNTPRACIVSILGRAAPDHVLWVTVINELFKSLNGPNALLAQSAWAHWSNPCLHRFDSDSQRIQSRIQSLGIQFRKLGSGQGAKWCVKPPRGMLFLRFCMFLVMQASRIAGGERQKSWTIRVMCGWSTVSTSLLLVSATRW